MRLEEAREKVQAQGMTVYDAVKKVGVDKFFEESPDAIKTLLQVEQKEIDELVQQSLWYCEHDEWDQAVEALACLLFYEPFNPSHYLRLGSVLICTGKFKEALDPLVAAASFSEDDPMPYLHLGNCFLELSDREKAQEAFTECITICSTHPQHQSTAALARSALTLVR